MNRQATDWEKIVTKHLSNKGLVSKIYEELLVKLSKKNTNNTPKQAEDVNRYKKKIHEWP